MFKVNTTPQNLIGKSFKNAKGNSECVELIKQNSNIGATGTWKRGNNVMAQSPNSIESGTIIATFEERSPGHYHYKGHAAMYISHDKSKITVIDQWNGHAPSRREIKSKETHSGKMVNIAENYYIVIK